MKDIYEFAYRRTRETIVPRHQSSILGVLSRHRDTLTEMQRVEASMTYGSSRSTLWYARRQERAE